VMRRQSVRDLVGRLRFQVGSAVHDSKSPIRLIIK
jgi:hypothetical protein